MGKYQIFGGIKAENLQIGDHNTMNTFSDETQINWEILEKAFHNARKENGFSNEEKNLLTKGEELARNKDRKKLFTLIKSNLSAFCKDIFCKFAASGLIELIKILAQDNI